MHYNAPNDTIRLAEEIFIGCRVDVVADPSQGLRQRPRHVLVELEPHYAAGLSSTGKSSLALFAAKAIAALM